MSVVPADVLIDRESDSYLVQKCLKGDRQSFSELYRRYEHKVRSTLYQLCGPSSLDDLVQEVFLKAWKGLPKFRQASSFSTWLYRIAWNVAADHRRSQAVQRSGLQHLTDTGTPHAPAPDLMQMHYQDLVQRGLERLSFEHRSVMVLQDLEDLPQKQVAEILGLPVGTVKSRLFHARAALRQFLQLEGVEL
ncbi:MAG: sigma-70 family RNA polymerase sigma factor [Oscillatoria sp. Prado101]|nr:sigma-70 family RNA polymerase sigma factor [Oscillatoria sp. Prado101]